MYDAHFGFTSRPFALTPDPAFLYQSRQHQMALSVIEYGLESQAPLLLLTGEIGSGKTTLLRRMIRDVGDRFATGLISNTHSQMGSLIAWALQAFDVAPANGTPVAAYQAIVDHVVGEYAQGRRTLLIVDEAQNLAEETLEELRLLSNVNSEQDLVLQILLVGQPELRDVLGRPSMRQTAQRVAADFHLRALDHADTAGYIAHRLTVAGGPPDLFTGDAVAIVHARSGGVPRLINQLCDYALVYAYADERRCIDAETVLDVLRDRERAGALKVFDHASAAVPHHGPERADAT